MPKKAGSILDTCISSPAGSRICSPAWTSAAVTVTHDSVMLSSCQDLMA